MGLGQSSVGGSTLALLCRPHGVVERALVLESPGFRLCPGSAACFLNKSLGLSNLHFLFYKAEMMTPTPQARGKGRVNGGWT